MFCRSVLAQFSSYPAWELEALNIDITNCLLSFIIS